MNKVVSAIRDRLVTILVWAVIILVIFGIVSYNRANQAKIEAALSSPSQSVRDAAVLNLVRSDRLIDALTNTQNPNEEADSPQNKKSVTIRQNAADSVNRLIAAKNVNIDQAFNTLFLLRKDADAGVKSRATDGLAKLGGESAANLQQVVQRLKDGDPDIRSAAVDALAKIGGDKSAKAVNAMLKDPAAQDAASSALAKIGAPSVPYLLPYLNPATDPDVIFRQHVINDILNPIASPQAVPALIHITQTDIPPIRRVAIVALANTVLSTYNAQRTARDNAAQYQKALATAKADPKAAPPTPPAPGPPASDFPQVQTAEPTLVAALDNGQLDSETRSQSALALGDLAGTQAVQALVTALGDYDNLVAQSARDGLQKVGAPAVAPLVAVLARGNDKTRAAAAQALGGIGSPQAIAALNAAFASPATPIAARESAAVGLGRSNNAAAIPSLVHALGDPNGAVASAASQALVTPELEQPAIPQLIAAFTQPTPVPFYASQTLSQMGDAAIPALKLALASPDPQVQTWAAVTLGLTETKDPAVTARLASLKSSANPQVQYAASQALNRLSGA